MDRREFLRATLSGTIGMLVADRLAAAAPGRSDPGQLVSLGRGLKVTRLGFGTGMSGGNRQSNQTRLGPEKFERLVQYAYDRNVRLFDMADLYGTHRYVARALRGKPRDSYTLVTKVWLHPGGLPEARAARRRRLPATVPQGVRHRLLRRGAASLPHQRQVAAGDAQANGPPGRAETERATFVRTAHRSTRWRLWRPSPKNLGLT